MNSEINPVTQELWQRAMLTNTYRQKQNQLRSWQKRWRYGERRLSVVSIMSAVLLFAEQKGNTAFLLIDWH
jgi:hypothetical protein